MDFRLAHRASILELTFRGASGGFESCPTLSVHGLPLDDDRIAHVVVTLQPYSQRVYVNGLPSQDIYSNVPADLRHWHEEYSFQFFSDHVRLTRPWFGGTIYQFLVYNQTLTEAEINRNFLAGLPETLPLGVDQIVTMNEDAELVAGSHEPEWYERARVFDDHDPLPSIQLRASWLEEELQDLLLSRNLIAARAVSPLRFFVTNLPQRGSLYQLDGSLLNSTMEEVRNSGLVVFIPQLNTFSEPLVEYTSFEYCVASHGTPNGECYSGRVSLFVESVNDPPLPQAPDGILVQEGEIDYTNRREPLRFGNRTVTPDTSTYGRRIVLTGTDPGDNIDSIAKVMVTRPPELGYLTINKQHIETLDWIFDGPAEVEYYAHAVTQTVSNETFVTDYFQFKVADRNGTWSKEATATIQIASALYAVNSTETGRIKRDQRSDVLPAVLENRPFSIVLLGFDASGFRRTISYQIISLPPTNAGMFMDVTDDNKMLPVQEGTILSRMEPFPFGSGVSVLFIPSPNFHNFPCSRKPRTRIFECGMQLKFSFRVVVVDGSGNIVSASLPKNQSFVVQNMNSPPSIQGPTDVQSVLELPQRVGEIQRDACEYTEGMAGDGGYNGCRYRAFIHGVNVSDPDLDIDPVWVRVSVDHGLLCLNPKHLVKALDVGCVDVGDSCRAYTCDVGTIVVLAFPSEVNDILSNLSYQSRQTGNDSLLFEVLDGVGDGCLPNKWLDRGDGGNSIHPTCYRVTHTIPILVLSSNSSAFWMTEEAGITVDYILWTVAMTYIVFVNIIFRVELKFRDQLLGLIGLKEPPERPETDSKLSNWAEDMVDEATEESSMQVQTSKWETHVDDETGDTFYRHVETGTVSWGKEVLDSCRGADCITRIEDSRGVIN